MSGQPNVINDVGTLLKIPNKITTELVSKANLCIGSIINDENRKPFYNIFIGLYERSYILNKENQKKKN